MKYNPRYIDNSPWDSPEKVEYRLKTIIEPYRQHFGASLPEDTQYWTLCGAHYNEEQQKPLKAELGQLVEEAGLIQPHQFHGVDRNEQVITRNREIYPAANWYCGEFQAVINQAYFDKNFNPALIHFDSVQCVETIVLDMKRLFSMLDETVRGSLMLVINIILSNPHCHAAQKCGEDFMEEFLDIYSCPNHWFTTKQYYCYGGAGGKSRSVMGTFIWIKKPHRHNDYTGHNIFKVSDESNLSR